MATTKREKKPGTKRGKKHKGVVLLPPQPKKRMMRWRARYIDPDVFEREGLEKHKYESLPEELTTAPQREHWAAMKADELAARRLALALGALPKTGKGLDEVIGRFVPAHPKLSERSKEDYEAMAAKILAWAKRAGIDDADKFDRQQLMRFREFIVTEKKKAPAKGKGAGRRRVATRELRSSARINTDLRKCATVLRYLVDACEFAKLSIDDVRRFAKPIAEVRERIVYLEPAEIRQSLEAALRHDAATFDMTRAELAGERPKGTTPRHPSIAPFVMFCLLTGARLGEALNLMWDEVKLDALDSFGRQVGKLELVAVRLKTRRFRDIDLTVSPALRALLAALKLASGGKGRVFTLTENETDKAALRLREEFGAPAHFGFQVCRRTCATFLTNAPGIFGAASASRSAAQLGHSVQTAQAYYLGRITGIPAEAKTLEAAMQIEELVAKVVARISAGSATRSAEIHELAVRSK